MRLSYFLILIGILIFAASCDNSDKATDTPDDIVDGINESFEDGLSRWSVRSLDTDVGTTPIEWHLTISEQMASDSDHSVEIYVDNLTDAAKIWLECSLDVSPDQIYSAKISFDIASSDAGEVNTFQILANVLPYRPETSDDVVRGIQVDGNFPEGTYNGGTDGFVWLEKSLEKDIIGGESGRIYFILGIWGTFEGSRTYYFDKVNIEITD